MKFNKTFEEQLDIFIQRGIQVSNKSGAIKKLENISYYKLKEYAKFFIAYYDKNGNPIYSNITFEELLKIYYRDKNLRIQLLHSIEKIEISLKTRIAYCIGDLNEYGYMRYNDWMDRNMDTNEGIKILNKYTKVIENCKPEYDFETGKEIIKHVKQYRSIWDFVNKLMFGEMVVIFECMNKRRKKKIAQYYNMNLDEFKSWIKVVRLIRNICSHNGKVVDIKLKSRPKIRNSWENNIELNAKTDLALICCILNEFVKVINKNYDFRKLKKVIYRVADNESTLLDMGFKDKNSIDSIFKKDN